MNLAPSTEQDIPKLTEWIKADPYHKDCLDPVWWLTGNGILSFRIDDNIGCTMYARTDFDNGLLRFHTQFAPESEVNKSRTVKAILWTVPKMKILAQQNNLTGFIFKSTSPLLIQFMMKEFGFVPVGSDDYRMLFEG